MGHREWRPGGRLRRGERKHRIAEEYLAAHRVSVGVFLILVARALATTQTCSTQTTA